MGLPLFGLALAILTQVAFLASIRAADGLAVRAQLR
jgi:hypothetical protein